MPLQAKVISEKNSRIFCVNGADPWVFSLLSLHQQVLFNVVDENVKLSHGLVDSVLTHLQVKANSV